MRKLFALATAGVFVLTLPLACGDDDDDEGAAPGPLTTGRSCAAPGECYRGLDSAAVRGEVVCMTGVPEGYCTHFCTTDADCCAVAGECPHSQAEVCGPFESTGEMYCFIGCEKEAVEKSGLADETAYCQKFASAAFICRSTGGGSLNRKVCVPNG